MSVLSSANLVRLWQSENGQGMTEYLIMISLVSLAAIACLRFFGGRVNNTLSNSASQMS